MAGRKTLKTEFHCALCKRELEISFKESEKTSHSACDVTNIIAIEPCYRCYHVAITPLDGLGAALKRAEELRKKLEDRPGKRRNDD